MRIVQIIDSLEPGGAEKMAVNYANALSHEVAFSGLIASRREGSLKNQIDSKVKYLFLDRKNTFDVVALLRLKVYCRKNKIDYVQAHSSSFFLAVLLKIIMPKIKIIWHDHYGLSDFVNDRKSFAIKSTSIFFEGIISVNERLKNWAGRELHCKKIIYLPNFTINTAENPQTKLKGEAGKRILCLANLREQKNHLLLLEVAKKIKTTHPNWTFHLVGKDFEDEYSKVVRSKIVSDDLGFNVFVYGAKNDVQHIISQCDVAILTSKSEGLPVALLEYGLNQKPVVVTAVGEIPSIVCNGKNGFVVSKDDTEGFCNSLLSLIESESLRLKSGVALEQTIKENHSADGVVRKLIDWLREN